MKPLRVALIHRNSPRCMDYRMVGYWSYPVPEFEWTHFAVSKGFVLDKDHLKSEGYDVVVYEDAKLHGEFTGNGNIPVCYVVVDSTLSPNHYHHRVQESQSADVILVDWDNLSRFRRKGVFTVRWSHCVNDRYFKDYELNRDIDIGSFQGHTKQRAKIDEVLSRYADSRNLRFEHGTRGWDSYARDMARAKVVVNVGRNISTRSHRVFDAMACRSCVVTTPLPGVSDEPRQAGKDYIEFYSVDGLWSMLDVLFLGNQWRLIADNGYNLVQRYHTWSHRAKQLREILEGTVL